MRFLNRKVRDITKRIVCSRLLPRLGKNPMRIVVLVSFHLHLNRKENMFLKHYMSQSDPQRSGLCGNSILTLHEDWKMKRIELCETFLYPLSHPQYLVRVRQAALSSAVWHREASQLGGMGHDCHVRRLILCRPISNVILHGRALLLHMLQMPHEWARHWTKQPVTGSGDGWVGPRPAYCDTLRNKTSIFFWFCWKKKGEKCSSVAVVMCSGTLDSEDNGLLGATTSSSLWRVRGLVCEGSSHGGPWRGPCPHCSAPSHSPWATEQSCRVAAGGPIREPGTGLEPDTPAGAQAWAKVGLRWCKNLTERCARPPLWQQETKFWHQKILPGFLRWEDHAQSFSATWKTLGCGRSPSITLWHPSGVPSSHPTPLLPSACASWLWIWPGRSFLHVYALWAAHWSCSFHQTHC